MNRALVVGMLLLCSCEKEREPVIERPWPHELSTVKSLVIAWEDLEGAPVTRTITGEQLGRVRKFFPVDSQSVRTKCGFHRDASFTLTSGKKIDLCFGCGITDGGGGEYAFNSDELKAVYVELLGPQPKQKNLFPR